MPHYAGIDEKFRPKDEYSSNIINLVEILEKSLNLMKNNFLVFIALELSPPKEVLHLLSAKNNIGNYSIILNIFIFAKCLCIVRDYLKYISYAEMYS